MKDEAVVLRCGIRALRNLFGWTQQDLAKKAGMGLAQVTAIETLNRVPSFQVLARIAHCANMQISRLMAVGEEHYIEDTSGYKSASSDLTDEPVIGSKRTDAEDQARTLP